MNLLKIQWRKRKGPAMAGMALLVCLGAIAWGESDRQEVLKDHEAAKAQRQWNWAYQRQQHESAQRRIAFDRAERHTREIVTAMGGPAAYAAKHPDHGIGQSIEQVATACLPAGGRARVRLDRFTEFTLIIELPRPTGLSVLAQIAQCILAERATYLFRLQFVEGGRLVAELDRQAIESAADWRHQSLAAVEALLLRWDAGTPSLSGGVPTVTAAGRGDEERNLTDEGRRQHQAMQSFQALLEKANKDLNASLKEMREACEFSSARPELDLAVRWEKLHRAYDLVEHARPGVAERLKQLERLLHEGGVDEIFARATLRTMTADLGPTAATGAEVIEKAHALIQSALAMLRSLNDHTGQWSFDPAAGAIQFRSERAGRELRTVLDGLRASEKSLAQAIISWNQATRNTKH